MPFKTKLEQNIGVVDLGLNPGTGKGLIKSISRLRRQKLNGSAALQTQSLSAVSEQQNKSY